MKTNLLAEYYVWEKKKKKKNGGDHRFLFKKKTSNFQSYIIIKNKIFIFSLFLI